MSMFSELLVHQNWLYLWMILGGIVPCMAISIHFSRMCSQLAYRLGDPTPKLNGRDGFLLGIQLHPVGFLLFVTTGIGWAKELPLHRENFKHPTKDGFLVLLYGVFHGILLGWGLLALGAFLDNLGLNTGFMQIIVYFLLYSGLLSLSFSLFQLLPLPFTGMYLWMYPLFPPTMQQILQKIHGHILILTAVTLWSGVLRPIFVAVLAVLSKPICGLCFFPCPLLEAFL